jgi:hypothetical protein
MSSLEALARAKQLGYVDAARQFAAAAALDPVLVCAMIEQESGWDEFSIRPESHSGFKQRYGDNYAKIVKASATKNDDRWFDFDDVFYCSYGLMQTMYPVVIERFPDAAPRLPFPTYLCIPAIGLEYGTKMFKEDLASKNQDVRLALLRWNGGGDVGYPDKVLARTPRYR